ncbi:MAG: adenosine kinase [Planctomycetes bacterium]|jgi:sugar/nucleoside kinase (ribokinase family)|nr:adenosine kinase [Planctomycetota bacterium]MCL4730208.1 adenosine kinase [Planctomycetota bacterium]
MTQMLDVTAIGNALVDVLAHASDNFLAARGIAKGSMNLVSADAARALYAAMGPAVEVSGGSAANTVAGIAGLGGRAAFIGKVSNDQLGEIFRHDIRGIGVHFDSAPSTSGAPTGRCLVLVTPDAQRTMQTCLGSAGEVGPRDVDAPLIERSRYTYFEGYLWDAPPAKQAYLAAAEIAHNAGRKTALSLSDKFCVDRHRAEFLDLVHGHIDVLFANELEIMALYQTPTFEAAAAAVRGKVDIAVLTRSEKGAVIVTPRDTIAVPAHPVPKVVDTTGAGDLFAAGFLFGLCRDRPPAECGRIAAICAAEIISHVGARPEARLADLIA